MSSKSEITYPPVPLGFIVCGYKKDDKNKTKRTVLSRLYLNRGAAEIFQKMVEPGDLYDYVVVEEKIGFDGINSAPGQEAQG